jgi:quercetin dioxygenase-like cupin family protein
MDETGVEKSKVHNIAGIIEYSSNSVATKTIMHKITGKVTLLAFDSGQELTEAHPFDTLVQVIEGKAIIIINDKSNLIESGQCIIIPAHCHSTIKAEEKFKMLSSLIKSKYEQ